MEVQDAQDLVRLLEAKPELRADMRRIVLTDDLLALPEQFARALIETDLRFREIAEAQRHTDERLADLIEVVSGMGTQIGVLKGELLEMRYQARAAAYLGRLLRRAR